ncbi:MAG: glutamate--cysteine ligase [Pseudomonadota bacterium]
MSAPPSSKGAPITDKAQLIAYLEEGCKAPEDWRIGTEHEKFAYSLEDFRRLPYHGDCSISAVLKGMEQFGWQPVYEGENVIALSMDGASVSLEPGGQFELSGAPLENIHETCNEVHTHLHQVKQVAEPMKAAMMGLGFDPKWAHEDIPWMPKGRYNIMSAYMEKVGTLGLSMMFRTCTVQVNLDYQSEADMVKKFRVSLALQPIATALFANSPFSGGKPNGFLSYRSHIWTDTDPDRCGILPFVFDDGMGFERYVDHVLDVPMYFVYRDGTYIDASGQSFRDFLKGELPALPGEIPTTSDWADHLSTLFPEVRLKRFLEMRGADGGPWKGLCALPALWVGLLYDQEALDGAWDLVKDWTHEDHVYLREDVPYRALHTKFRGRPLKELAGQVVALASLGLKNRARVDGTGNDETGFLDLLRTRVETGWSPAEYLLQDYDERWGQVIDPIFTECAY